MSARARRRGDTRRELVTIVWRDIPAQVTATDAGRAARAMLPSRFQRAIDRAAHVAGLTDRHDYIAQWRRVSVPLDAGADLDAAVAAEVARLDALHDRDSLAALVRSGGLRGAGTSTKAAR
jgi:hypothetical protein